MRANVLPASAQTDLADRSPTHGHSMYGDAFNEGPRQRAYLMKGMAHVHFPITTTNRLAQRFFDQGVGQLHGFWYLEAERSFREVAMLDTNCAMAYWGMAMANEGNEKRAREFIAKAVELRSKASPREQMWIDAWAGFLKEKQDDKTRSRAYARALWHIETAYPNDIEAKAFHALQLWENSYSGVPLFSRKYVDSEMRQVLAKNPRHPLHHYIIHLWNYTKDENALTSAASCGPAEPGIAHMWHMPGHTYSALKRYADAAWQQEASARVDHAHMIHDWVLPDQIHNFAHNNQWLVEDLLFIGRVHDAIDLAKNMIELPMHPAYNTAEKGGSFSQGRRRLLQALTDYELWDELIAMSETVYLPPTDVPDFQDTRLYSLGVAAGEKRDSERLKAQVAALEGRQKSVRASKDASAAPDSDARKQADGRIKTLEGYLAELRGYQALAAGRNDEARKLFDKSKSLTKWRHSRLLLETGDRDGAEKLAREAVKDQENQVQPLANLVDILSTCGKHDDAIAEMKKLQKLSANVDLDMPVFRRIARTAQEVAAESTTTRGSEPAADSESAFRAHGSLHATPDSPSGAGMADISVAPSGSDPGRAVFDRRPAPVKAADIGPRPSLDSLGPFRWSPPVAPNWSLRDAASKRVSLSDYRSRGRAVLLLLYLGGGCTQCMEQLNAFVPVANQFEAAGIDIVAIGTDSLSALPKTSAHAKGSSGFPFPLLSDYGLKVFRAYRAYDDFEKMPLHGAYLVDAAGRVRWLDISFQPFMDTKFLLEESKRLLAIEPAGDQAKNSHE